MLQDPRQSGLIVERLRPEHVLVVYPLIRAVEPSIARREWVRYARRVLLTRSGRRGVLVARRATQRHPSGAVCYRLEPRIAGDTILVAEHLAALDLLFPETMISALMVALDGVATSLRCNRIRFVCRGTDQPMLQTLRDMGYCTENHLLSRPVGVWGTNLPSPVQPAHAIRQPSS